MEDMASGSAFDPKQSSELVSSLGVTLVLPWQGQWR
jgi:hypothetical protein